MIDKEIEGENKLALGMKEEEVKEKGEEEWRKGGAGHVCPYL